MRKFYDSVRFFFDQHPTVRGVIDFTAFFVGLECALHLLHANVPTRFPCVWEAAGLILAFMVGIGARPILARNHMLPRLRTLVDSLFNFGRAERLLGKLKKSRRCNRRLRKEVAKLGKPEKAFNSRSRLSESLTTSEVDEESS